MTGARLVESKPAPQRQLNARAALPFIITTLMAWLGAVFCLTPMCLAQDVLWRQFYEAGCTAQKKGDLSLAEKQLAASLQHVEALDNSDDCLLVLKSLATVYADEGKFEQADVVYQKMLVLDEKANRTVRICSDLRSLAQLSRKQGRVDQCLKYLQKAIDLVRTAPDNDTLLASLLAEKAITLQQAGNLDKVESTLLEAIRLCERAGIAGGAENVVALSTLERLADFYTMQSRYAEAEPLYARCITQRRANGKAQDGALIKDIVSLAVLLQKQDKQLDAELLFKQALAMSETQFGANSAEAAVALMALARFYSEQLKSCQSIPLLQRALVIRVATYPESDLRLSETLGQLANAFLDQDDYASAEKYLKRALAIDGQNNQAAKQRIIIDLSSQGKLYLCQAKYKQAEIAYKQALEITEAEKGLNHPDTASAMNNLALLYRNSLEYAHAITLLRKALAIREQAFGLDHPMVAQNLVNLADVLSLDGKPEEAESLLTRALKINEAVFTVEHESVAIVLRDLVDVIRLQNGKADKAEIYARRLLARDKRTTSDDSQLVARDMELLARLLIVQDKLDEAKSLKQQAAVIKNKSTAMTASQSIADDTSVPAFNAKPVREKWALLVGISSFQDPALNLKYAAKDATDFSNFLIKEANFKPANVKLLTDADATRANIVSLLGDKWLKRVAQCDDLVVIYISSHGTQAAHQVGDTNFIVPFEANVGNIVFTGIPMQWLNAGLTDLVHCDRTYVFLDVCHSGAATRVDAVDVPSAIENAAATAMAPSSSSPTTPASDSAAGQKSLRRPPGLKAMALSTGKGQIVVAASQADQISWESKRYANGVFTRNLIKGLKINGDRTTMGQAYSYLKDSVEEEVLRDRGQLQSPMMMPRAGYGSEANIACPSVSQAAKTIVLPAPAISKPRPH